MDEKFYQSICNKYVDTISKAMLLEIDNKILHFLIEDEYIELKDEGKINSQNYKDYLDGNYEVYKYNSYKDLYDSNIKNEIIYDIKDLGLFDDNNKWNFYISFEELKKMGYGFMVSYQYPIIEKCLVSKEEGFEFYKHFSLQELDDFEKTLYLYFEIDDIELDNVNLEIYSKSNSKFNSNIIFLAEGLLTYEEFLEDYIEQPLTNYDISLIKVTEYFKEHNIKDLMEYGNDADEGLYPLSALYKEIMDKLNIEYESVFTKDDVSDGKYITTVVFNDSSVIKLDTRAWDDIRGVTDNIESICEMWNIIKEKNIENEIEDIEI